MGWTEFFIGVLAGGVLVGLVTTESGRSVSHAVASSTAKGISRRYAQLVE